MSLNTALKTGAVMWGSITSLLQRLSELFRRLQKFYKSERHISCNTPSGSCSRGMSSLSSFCFERLANSSCKLNLDEDTTEIQSDFSCDQESSSLWLIPKGLPAPAHPMLLPCRADPVPLSPVLTRRGNVHLTLWKCPGDSSYPPRSSEAHGCSGQTWDHLGRGSGCWDRSSQSCCRQALCTLYSKMKDTV